MLSHMCPHAHTHLCTPAPMHSGFQQRQEVRSRERARAVAPVIWRGQRKAVPLFSKVVCVTRVCACVRAFVRACTCACVRAVAGVRARARACVHARTHAHMHARTTVRESKRKSAHAYTHTQARPDARSRTPARSQSHALYAGDSSTKMIPLNTPLAAQAHI